MPMEADAKTINNKYCLYLYTLTFYEPDTKEVMHMNKALTIIGCLLIAVVIVVGIIISIPPKTLDFRGTVTEIDIDDSKTIFHIEQSSDISYIVVADNKTKVRHCHKDDPKITLEEIQVGHTIEGDYRKPAKNNEAKFITAWCKN